MFNCFARPKKVNEIKKEIGLETWTTRLVFSKKGEGIEKIERAKNIFEILNEYNKIDYFAVPLDYPEMKRLENRILESFSEDNKLFISVNIEDVKEELQIERVKEISKILKRISEISGEEGCIRFSLSYMGQPETAYFPNTTSKNTGFSISLRYVNDIVNGIKRGIKVKNIIEKISRKIDENARIMQKKIGLKYLGTDLSISPWMEESVMKLIELIKGDKCTNPGFYSAIYKLNEAIESTKDVKKTGFNEVMLPVAEDNLLKEYVANEKIKISELIGAIAVCVAGLDMLAIPYETEEKIITKIMLDAITVAKSRKKRIGIRLILANGKSGDEVKIKNFGKVPIAKVNW